MILLSDLDFSLPLSNPVIIFSIVLFVILFAPILFNRLRIPHLIGLIIAGVIIGPHGFNLLMRDSSMVLFGTVGLLYIMFTAGLEIDLEEFRKNRVKSLVFGLYTFFIPITLGTLAAYYILRFSLPSSIILASMFSSHTLLAYPIASRYGIARIRSVTMTIGGTIITDILALLVLAAIVGMTKGEIGSSFWIQLFISSLIFAAIVFFVFPLIARWFFKKFDDNIAHYIFVLAMVFLGSFLAEVAGLEHIIGAFLSGLSLNRFIPHSSALMNRIDFVGNAIFIPFFLISVGMLVDFRVLFMGWGALKVAGIMIVMAVLTKFLAAWITQKTFRLSADERKMIFGLSNARVGATLAVVLVGYNTIIGESAAGEPIRLLNEDILNGTVLMILVTCTISSISVERASRNIALQLEKQSTGKSTASERIMVSLAYPDTVTQLVDFGLMLRGHKDSNPLHLLHVVDEEGDKEQKQAQGRKMIETAARHAAATDNSVSPLIRHDLNISNGIIYTIKEQSITDVVIGLHQGAQEDNFFGATAERILKGTSETMYIYKPTQPFNTLKRMIVVVPPRAEFEPGFAQWYGKLLNLAREAGLSLVFYAHPDTIPQLKGDGANDNINIQYQPFTNWEDFLIFSREVRKNDLFVIISSRKGYVSYQAHLDRLPHYLSRYFSNNSFVILYPKQLEHGIRMSDVQHVDSTLIESISENIGAVGKAANHLRRLFGRRK